ncbi:hypothetical protein P3T18_005810 [Paraburkholderia sp. GAS199]
MTSVERKPCLNLRDGHAHSDAGPSGRAPPSGGTNRFVGATAVEMLGRVPATAARGTRGRLKQGAPQHRYFESHDLRCSSKKARTCSGSSAPKNSTPAGSGSGQKTLSGVGIFVGLASMISLLYKPIICLGPCFAPASNADSMSCVALTEQVNPNAECLNRIYRLTLACLQLVPIFSSRCFLPVLACLNSLRSPPSLGSHAFQVLIRNPVQYQWFASGDTHAATRLLCIASSPGFYRCASERSFNTALFRQLKSLVIFCKRTISPVR